MMELLVAKENQFQDLKQQHVKNSMFYSKNVTQLVIWIQEMLAEQVTRSHWRDVSIGHPSARQMPTSCQDLNQMGHILNGLYSVMGTEMVQSVYCDFTLLPSDVGKS